MSVMTRATAAVAGLALAAGALTACGGGSGGGGGGGSAERASARKDTYDIYLSNSYLGEGWRTQMVKTAEAALRHKPLQGRVKLTVVTSEQNTPSSQIQSLNNIILKKPDAIVVDPASPPALTPVLNRACDQGITVVGFDQVVQAKCARSLHVDFPQIGRRQAEWMARTLKGRGGVLQDQGLPGTTISTELVENQRKVLAEQAPGIKILDTFTSEFAPGPEQKAVSSLLAAHSDVDGLFSQGYVSGSFAAFRNAGRPVVPFAAFAYNGPMSDCATVKGAECYLAAAPPYQSAWAIKLAVDVMDGKQVPKDTVIPSECFVTNGISPKGQTCERIQVGKNAFPKLSPDLVFPVSPPWTDISVQEVTGNV
jgi:ribose transport system substrate-binding protein